MTISNRILKELDTSPVTLKKYPNRYFNEVEDLRGKHFGELTVKNYFGKKGNHTYWECLCSCGNTSIVRREALIKGQTISCGHINREKASKRIKEISTTHGASNEKWFSNYTAMITRATKINSKSYKEYHKRHPEITKWIEDDWVKDPWKFYEEIGEKPNSTYSIDRIDNHKGYIKGNIQWTTPERQVINRDTSKLDSYTGYTGISFIPKGTNRRATDVYQASISYDNKKHIIGYYDTLEMAKVARYNEETKHGFPHNFTIKSTIAPVTHKPIPNKNILDIKVGDKNNELTVEKLLPNSYIECLCSCGNTVKVRRNRFVNGMTKHCKDYNKHPKQNKIIDGNVRSTQRSNYYKGKKYNHLTLICFDHTDKVYNVYWKAKCDCGKTIVIPINSVITGHNKTCGHSKYKYIIEDKEGNTITYNSIGDLRKAYGISSFRLPKDPTGYVSSKRSPFYNHYLHKVPTIS